MEQAVKPWLSYLEVMELLEKTPKTNDKKAILLENKGTPHLMELLKYALDDRIVFNIKEIKNVEVKDSVCRMDLGTWDNFERVLIALSSGSHTGHAAHAIVNSFLSMCTDLEKKWFLKCIQKDLASTKVGTKIMNEIWPGSVLRFEVALADQEDKIDKILNEDGTFIDGYAYEEPKKNGVRTLFRKENGIVDIPVGRSGLPISNFSILIKGIEQLDVDNIVLDGEVTVDDCLEDAMSVYGFDMSKTEEDFKGKSGKTSKKWGEYLARKAEIEEMITRLKFTIFHIIPTDEWDKQYVIDTYEEMRVKLLEIIEKTYKRDRGPFYPYKHTTVEDIENLSKPKPKPEWRKRLVILPSTRVETYEEARELTNKRIAEGCEGSIYKRPHAKYSFKRCTDWIKAKEMATFEAVIIGWKLSKQKFNGNGSKKEPMLGAFTVECYHPQTNEIITFEVGTGKLMDEKFRIAAAKDPDSWMNKVLECSCQRFTDKAAICPRAERARPDRVDLDS
ncbi:MAG: hypothetical protein WDA09_02240 [Bacteriovoracaceae bacterium]